jgi:hypothetical protein
LLSGLLFDPSSRRFIYLATEAHKQEEADTPLPLARTLKELKI